MKKNQRYSSLILGAVSLGIILSAGTTARAADRYQYRTMNVGFNWNSTNVFGVFGTPGTLSLATAGNTYFAGGAGTNFNCRTHDASTNNPSFSVFAGDKLILTNNGIGSLVLKNGGGLANVNSATIELAGGTISQNTPNQLAGTDGRSALGGTILVSQNSLINLIGGATANRDTLLVANISGSANLTVAHGAAGTPQTNALVLLGTNTAFSGNWTNTLGRIELGNNALNPLGSGKVMLMTTSNALNLNATNDFSLANVIEGVGIVIKANSNSVTLNGANTFIGSTVVSNGVLKLGNASAVSTSTNISLQIGRAHV